MHEFDELSRREKRYIRRKERRARNLEKRNQTITLEQVFTFDNLYYAGRKCCNGVRWKQSTQNFELHLFRQTAIGLRKIKAGTYKFSKYKSFMLNERGKVRKIDAPKITDRQVQKLYTNEVLLPAYQPMIIKNNCASLPGQGLSATFKLLKNDLKRHYKQYGLAGGILLADAKQFFPNANHNLIYWRHSKYIKDTRLRELGDAILRTVKEGVGLPLGVEPSQLEMIGLPSQLDNFMKCQMHIKGYGHYMDDFYIIVPPGEDYKEVFKRKALENKIILNLDKTYYVPFSKPFKFCKAQFRLLKNGKIIMRANRKSLTRNRQKIKKLYQKMQTGEINEQDLYASVNAMIAYLNNYNEHTSVLKLKRLFYSLFHISIERLVAKDFKNYDLYYSKAFQTKRHRRKFQYSI